MGFELGGENKPYWRAIMISDNDDDIDDSASFHMALWPYMLARPTCIMRPIDPKRQASVLFQLVVDGVGGMFAFAF